MMMDSDDTLCKDREEEGARGQINGVVDDTQSMKVYVVR